LRGPSRGGAPRGLAVADTPLKGAVRPRRMSPEEKRLAQQDFYRAAVGVWVQYPFQHLYTALKPAEPAKPPPPPITLGAEDAKGPRKFNLRVVVDPKGAGVRSVTIPRFEAVDENGRPAWKDPAEKKEVRRLELISEESTREQPAFLLYHFPTGSEEKPNEAPSPYLGETTWAVLDPGLKVDTEGDDTVHTVTFQAKVDGFIVQK